MLNVALLGFGVVGSGTAEILTENRELIKKRVGQEVNIKYILDLRDFPDSPFEKLIVHDFNIILNDPDVSVVAEMMGGSHPAYEFSKAALEAGKSVVTSNKECVAKFGDELLKIAAKNGCRYMFEASVGGGIPIIRPMMNDLTPVNVTAISGILNGTTNYILTKMSAGGVDFATVLANAQEKGYAERNPSADVDGLDAARKIVILTALATGIIVDADSIYCEGITKITEYDMDVAETFGYSIKLIGRFEKTKDGKILCMVSPRFVSANNPLYTVNDVFNGILVSSDMLDETMFYGRGAGKLPTAGAVVADILDIVSGLDSIKKLEWKRADAEDVADISEYSCRRVFTFEGTDVNKIEAVFGNIGQLVVNEGKISFVTSFMTEKDADELVAKCDMDLVSKFRIL
ncbi:MAG: homoserine dehydrogenase [Ruminococcaceae bacterium]|nr:homoserine dehydrogenase [Oscillospiraceae bacterium]